MLNQFSNSFFAAADATVVVHNSSAGADIASRLFSFCSVALNLVVIISFISRSSCFFLLVDKVPRVLGICTLFAVLLRLILFLVDGERLVLPMLLLLSLLQMPVVYRVFMTSQWRRKSAKKRVIHLNPSTGYKKMESVGAPNASIHTHYSDLIGDDFTRYRRTTNLHP